MNLKKLAPLLVLVLVIGGLAAAVAIINAPQWTTRQGNVVDCPPQSPYDVCLLTHPVGSTTEVLSAFSPDGTVLVTAGGSLARGWSMEDGSQLFEFNVGSSFKGLAFLPDGEHLVGANGSALRVWRLSDLQAVTMMTDQRNFDQMALSSDGQFVAGSTDFEIKLWRTSDGELVHLLRTGQTLVRSMQFSPDGRYLAVGRTKNSVEVYDVQSGELAFSIPRENVVSLAFTPDGRQLLMAYGKTAAVWDLENQELVREWQENAYDIAELGVSSDGRFLATGTSVGVFLRTLAGDELVDTLFNENRVGALTFSPDHALLVVSGMTREVRVWRLPL